MFSQHARQSAYLLAVVDGIVFLVAFYIALAIRMLADLPGVETGIFIDPAIQYWLPLLGIPLLWLTASRTGAYRYSPGQRDAATLWALLKAFVYVSVLLGTAVFLLQTKEVSRAVFFLFVGLGFLLVGGVRAILGRLARISRSARAETKNLLIVGTGPEALEIRQKLDAHPEYLQRVVGFVHGPGQDTAPEAIAPILGDFPEMESLAERHHVDDVIFALPFEQALACQNQLLWCEEVGITVHLRTDFVRTLFAKTFPTELDGTPMLTVSPVPRDPVALLLKRTIDFAGSLLGLLALSPLLLGIAAAIRVTSPGPILFRQRRVGLNGRIFVMLKFRSMYADAERRRRDLLDQNEVSGPVFKMKRDPRITPVGRILRKFSLDELPQLWNVLVGDMSLVGPRPPIQDEVKQYERWQRRRLSMRPGITCLWQVSGRNNVAFDEWMKLDLAYIDNWSLKLDFEILLRTVPAVVFARGAN